MERVKSKDWFCTAARKEYIKAFLQFDANPNDEDQYNKILSLHLRLKLQHEFNKQQSKISWLQSGDTNLEFFMLRCQWGSIKT